MLEGNQRLYFAVACRRCMARFRQSCSGNTRACSACAASVPRRGCGHLGTVLIDILRALGAVDQQHNVSGGHFSNAIAHQYVAGFAVHGELHDAHFQGNQHRAVSGLYAVLAVSGGQGQAFALALEKLAAAGRDVQNELFHQPHRPFRQPSCEHRPACPR